MLYLIKNESEMSYEDFCYYRYFFARRTAFLLTIFLYNENVQMSLVIMINCLSLIYLGNQKAINGVIQKRIEIFNEFMVHLISFHMYLFAGLVSDDSMKEKIGYSMVFCILLMMAFNTSELLL